MNNKIFSSGLISPSTSGLLDDIELELDERSLIAGAVVKEPENGRLLAAANALVSLYQGTSLQNCYPLYHTYADEKGRFLFPVIHTESTYLLKVFYTKTGDPMYKPFLSKPFQVPKNAVYKTICYLEKENRRVISGVLTDVFRKPRENVPVKFYLTVGKIPIAELAHTKTDHTGHYEFTISADGSYCIVISI